jgi:type I restriction enzyme, S subunit
MSELPKSWTRCKIGSLCELINGRAFKPTDWSATGLPIVRIQNLNNPDAAFNRFDGEVRSRFLIDSGALLFAWSGTPGTSFGTHIWNGGPAVLNQHIFNVIFDGKKIDKYFFRYAINQKLDELIDKAHGGVGLRHVTKGKFEATEIDLPPLAEQRLVVAKLDSLIERSKTARQELARVPRLVQRYKQAILAAAFRGDLTKDWRRTRAKAKKKVLEEVATARSEYFRHAGQKEKPAATPSWKPAIDLPPSWLWVSVDQLAALVQYGSSAKTSDSLTAGVPVLRMGNILDGNLDYRKLKYLPKTHNEFPELLLADGDILFNRTNSAELVGKTAVYSDTRRPTSFASYLIRIRVIGYLPELLSAYINSEFGRDWVRSVVNQQVGQANVNGTKLRELGVPLMPMDEQKELWSRINKAFAAIDHAATEAARAMELIDRLDQATLARAFRGELVSAMNGRPDAIDSSSTRGRRATVVRETGRTPRAGRSRTMLTS